MMETEITCPICLCEVENGLNLCCDFHSSACRPCLTSMVESTINGAFFGTCPVLSCPDPTHQESKKKKILQMNKWARIVPNDVTNRYKALSSHLLAFLCGGCHALKTLDVGFEANTGAPCYLHIQKLLTDAEGVSRYEDLRKDLLTFCMGDVELDEFYDILNTRYFPQLSVLGDPEAWEIFMALLRTIEEPERRANLHLRYLRDRPRMKTLCCNREHCFKCKIKDFHEGKTCLEYSGNLDNTIVSCPSCGIALARGDGCNTLTCVCGKQFSWSTEKENTERCHQFLAAFPEHTSEACADTLCMLVSNHPRVVQAKAWQTRHRMEVSRALRAWFKIKYAPCPTQCCATMTGETVTDGIREAMDLWKIERPHEIQRAIVQNDIALRSIFLTAFPNEAERAIAAHYLSGVTIRGAANVGIDPKLVASAVKWIENNRSTYTEGVERMEERSARQFLHLFGNRPFIAMKPSQSNFPAAFEFCRRTSNSDLTYTNNNTSVERVGSVSCYPAAFATLPSDRCMFRVVLDTAPRTSNWLTFGLAVRGMASSSSDGVGRTANSWGLSDDRSTSSSNTIIAAAGAEVAQFRKLRVGDVLCCTVDTSEGWCDVSINQEEFTHRFAIPSAASEQYVFAMTYANDHRVIILAEQIDLRVLNRDGTASDDKVGPELNRDHTVMLNNYKKHLKLILTEADEINMQEAPTSALMTDGVKWQKMCGGTMSVTNQTFEVLRPHIEQLLGLRREKGDIGDSAEALKDINCNTILEAVSWFRLNRDRIREEMKGEIAFLYSMTHGDSAPFLAAMTLASNSSGVDRSELQQARAYMLYFEDEMQQWYEIDAMSPEPLVEGVVKTCRCLPRHIRTCPKAAKSS